MINLSMEDDGDDEETDEEELALRAIMAADLEAEGPQDEEVEFTNTVKLTDTISVETSVKLKVPESEADKLRKELMGDFDENGIDEEKVEKLSESYSHLQKEADEDYDNEFNRRKGGNKDWR
jgi:hypothetical protein